MRFIPVTVVLAAMLQLPSPALTGRVVDPTGGAIPGATVRVSRGEFSVAVVTDESGRFHFKDLAEGPYLVAVSLAGFRGQTVDVLVGSSPPPEMEIRLSPGLLSHVDWIVPEPAEAFRMSAAVAHVRIDGTRPPGPCGDVSVVTSHHEASTLRVFAGVVPPRIHLQQEAAGRCLERGEWVKGSEQPYRAGDQYVVFLARRGDSFVSTAGPALTFPVRDGQVSLRGFAGVQGSISLDEFGDLLDRLGRNAPEVR